MSIITENDTENHSLLSITDFFSVLYDGVDRGHITISNYDSNNKLKSFHVPLQELHTIEPKVKLLTEKSNVYFGVGLREAGLNVSQRGGKNDITALTSLFVEIDIKGGAHKKSDLPTYEEAKTVLNSFNLEPSIVNHSGGGLHVYYLLDEPIYLEAEEDRQQAGKLLKRLENVIHALLSHKGKVADSVAELSRVLRPPNTLNHKYEPTKTVKTIHFKESRYSQEEVLEAVEDFEDRLNIEQEEPPQPQELTHEDIMSDNELIEKIMQSRQKDQFKKLFYDGDISDHNNDDSKADFRLAQILAFWTNKNPTQIERIMRKSSLNREKWDREDYLTDRTIMKAIEYTTNGYKSGQDDYHFNIDEPVKDLNDTDLKQVLKNRRFEEYQHIEQIWIDNGKNGRKPTTIAPVRCAYILMEHISFLLFDLEEHTRVAMYVPSEGVYTRNVTIIKRVISWLEPKLNNNKADEVIYHITNRAEVKDMTVSRDLIPVKNGIFNRKTKQLEPFSPEYVFTTKINTKYVENPSTPSINGWDIESWIESIACGDKEISTLLWQVINDSLNGNYTRRKAIFLIGEGNNGKGTFQELITNLVGLKNVASLKVNEFDQRFRLSVLEGKTVVIGDDVPVNVYIDDSSNFNSVVTGDVVSVEQKNRQPYETRYKCTIIQSTNGMPKFRNKTDGTIRRLVIVPFNANFNGKVENTRIKTEYIKDKEVLEYVLHKAINMDFEDFDIPRVSMNELELFKQDNDPVLDFKVSVFDEWTITKVPKCVVYDLYKKFCDDNGYRHLSERQFNKQFKSYLGNEWDTEAQGRFHAHKLIGELGDLDLMGIGFPDKSQVLKAYENTKLKSV